MDQPWWSDSRWGGVENFWRGPHEGVDQNQLCHLYPVFSLCMGISGLILAGVREVLVFPITTLVVSGCFVG